MSAQQPGEVEAAPQAQARGDLLGVANRAAIQQGGVEERACREAQPGKPCVDAGAEFVHGDVIRQGEE